MRKLTSEKCREQFEVWAKAEGLIKESFGMRSVNEQFLKACWAAWQASRQSLEIALPVLEHPGGWISCSERMPVQYQSNRYVPLTLLLNERTVAQGGFDDGKFWIDGVVIHNVTRWQPMPLPPSTTPQIDNDGWIKWGGGDVPPVEGLVEVRWSDASKDTGNAHKFRWYHYKIISNIIAYRVIENDGREG